jgi:SNF2 family DNA or RNA helicase
MPAHLRMEGDTLYLSLKNCRGMEFKDALERVRSMPARRWDPETTDWSMPATPANAERLMKTIRPAPEASDELLGWILSSKIKEEESLTSPLPDDADDLRIPWAYERAPWQPESVNDVEFKGLDPVQRVAASVIAERHRAILADEMGMGKTLEAISAIEEYALRNGQIEGPKLIVAPKSVKGSWARELNRWLEDPVVVIPEGTPATRTKKLEQAIEDNAWIIVNWEQLRLTKAVKKLRNGGKRTVTVMKEPLLESTEWLAVVADEAHRAKNRTASQTKGLWRVQGQVMIAATGTPVMNSPDELWSILRWLWPEQYHELGARKNAVSYWHFFEDHVEYYEDHFGKKTITGVKNPDALRYVLKDKLIRRLRPAGGKGRIYRDPELTPGQLKVYKEAEKQMWLEVEKQIADGDSSAAEFKEKAESGASVKTLWNLPNGAARLVRLQQIMENAALLGGNDESGVMDDIMQLIEDSRPEPWIVFFKFKESCEIFAERCRAKQLEVGVYTGDTPASKRSKLEDEFQAGNIDVMIGTVGAMKEGITLTKSHLVYIATESFVPAEQDQCEDRSNRKGQLHFVRVYIARPTGTVAESKVKPIIEVKRKIVKTITPVHDVQEDNA